MFPSEIQERLDSVLLAERIARDDRHERGHAREISRAANFWESREDGCVLCVLCPHSCLIDDGHQGRCRVRGNERGSLKLLSYGSISVCRVGPIERKPFNHFLSGSQTLSVGSFGCTLSCGFCQNWRVSVEGQILVDKRVSPVELVQTALYQGCESICFTYNEPVLSFEYVTDVARVARERGVKVVCKTNGWYSSDVASSLAGFVDGVNVDIKGFSGESYADLTEGELEDVLETSRVFLQSGKHVELSYLLIPGIDTSEETMRGFACWVVSALSCEVPVHLIGFYPDYKMVDSFRTSSDVVLRSRDMLRGLGLHHVYVSTFFDADGNTTYCSQCGDKLVVRNESGVVSSSLRESLACSRCESRNSFVSG